MLVSQPDKTAVPLEHAYSKLVRIPLDDIIC